MGVACTSAVCTSNRSRSGSTAYSARAVVAALSDLPDAGRWSDGDAERWWREAETELAATKEDAALGLATTATIDVDLSRRIGA